MKDLPYIVSFLLLWTAIAFPVCIVGTAVYLSQIFAAIDEIRRKIDLK